MLEDGRSYFRCKITYEYSNGVSDNDEYDGMACGNTSPDDPPLDPETGLPPPPPPEWPDDPVWPDDWANHPKNPCGPDSGTVLNSSGRCVPPEDVLPPRMCNHSFGVPVVGYGDKQCSPFRPDLDNDPLPPGTGEEALDAAAEAIAAGDEAAAAERVADLERAIADEIAAMPELHGYDGKVSPTPDGGADVAVGEGCAAGGGCTAFKFDAAGNLVGGREYPAASGGETIDYAAWSAPPGGTYNGATGSKPAGATTQPARGRIGAPHPWRGGSPAPSYTPPPSQPIKNSTGAVVGSRSSVFYGGVRTYTPTDPVVIYRDAEGNLCTGSACGYDPAQVTEDGTAGGGGDTGGEDPGGEDPGGEDPGGGTGGGDPSGEGEYPCTTEDCWGGGPGQPTENDLYASKYPNGFQDLWTKWEQQLAPTGVTSWMNYIRSRPAAGGCPQPPVLELGKWGTHQVEIPCEVWPGIKKLLAVFTGLSLLFILLRN